LFPGVFDGHAYYIAIFIQFDQHIFVQVFCNGYPAIAETNQERVCIFEIGDFHFAKIEKNEENMLMILGLFIMRPHAKNPDGLDILKNFVNQPVPDVYASGIEAGKIAQ
jgi:hypothetical protein